MHSIVGDWVSVTVTSKLHVAEFPKTSVTVKLLVVVPTGNRPPLGNPEFWVVTKLGQLSLAITEKLTTAPQLSASLLTLMFPGQEMVGAMVSPTVTVTGDEGAEVHPSNVVTTE